MVFWKETQIRARVLFEISDHCGLRRRRQLSPGVNQSKARQIIDFDHEIQVKTVVCFWTPFSIERMLALLSAFHEYQLYGSHPPAKVGGWYQVSTLLQAPSSKGQQL